MARRPATSSGPGRRSAPRNHPRANQPRNGDAHLADQPAFYTDPHDPAVEWRRLFAEGFGTALLTLVAAGADVIAAAAHMPPSAFARYVAPGLLVMAVIYTMGDVSGAHLNPAVTLAFTLRRDFPWRLMPGYWLAQLVGATLAAVFLRLVFGPVGHLGATRPAPGLGTWPALIMEAVLTLLLVTVILGTAHEARLAGHNAALAVGGTIALTGLFAGSVSGASMNPARSFGPALVSGNLSVMWIYVVGPLAGALLAAGIAWILHGPTTPYAIRTAGGAASVRRRRPAD